MRRISVIRAGRWLAGSWLLMLGVAAGLTVCWPERWLIVPVDVLQINLPPSAQHWLGTDPFGRDVLTDVVAGTHSLLTLSLPAAVLTSLLGILLGAAAGSWGNAGIRVPRLALGALGAGLLVALLMPASQLPWWVAGAALVATAASFLPQRTTGLPVDQLVQLSTTFLGSLPRLLLVLLLAAVHTPSTPWLIGLLTLTCWTATARLVRTQVVQLKHQGYIEAAYAAGFPASRVLLRHVLPNAWGTLRAALPLNLATCIALQTTLAFLGVGLPPDRSDWGRTLATARLEPAAWWLVAGAALPLAATVMALHVLLAGPQMRDSAQKSRKF
ncbi:ABC transporter permease [Hymenobacter latericus]|uniref:ABC transporter permease n=1 Tax=Hymenobacter sp. YIM 151858-1 TaxID=2987688 RepID=UPI0022264243|nr:ABC transporter permease [Hymenobacter sp. YIM 151858-1]UYZ59078.1 ABC transporter permease [Hymenobacter sp. YIM 151858-1]